MLLLFLFPLNWFVPPMTSQMQRNYTYTTTREKWRESSAVLCGRLECMHDHPVRYRGVQEQKYSFVSVLPVTPSRRRRSICGVVWCDAVTLTGRLTSAWMGNRALSINPPSVMSLGRPATAMIVDSGRRHGHRQPPVDGGLRDRPCCRRPGRRPCTAGVTGGAHRHLTLLQLHWVR